jgi:quinol monooxygenase YgiN
VYAIAVYFDIPPAHHADFIAAALEDGRNSGRDEPGTRRFELIRADENPNCFYLNEAYADAAAFDLHAKGPHFAAFFAQIASYADGPHWLIRGMVVPDTN